MKMRLIGRCIFTVILTIIVILMLFIYFDKTGNSPSINSLVDYVIENNSDECNSIQELIYSDNNKNYYIPCTMSNDILLVWNDGSKDYLKDALNNNKVTIKSLKQHGLEIYEEER